MLRKFLIASVLAFGASTASAAVLMNGDFETVDGTLGITGGNSDGQRLDSLAGQSGGKSWDVYETLPGGWYNFDDKRAGIEVQTQKTIKGIVAHSGNHYIELDSENTATTNSSNSQMAQDIFLKAGDYRLTFWYAPRPGVNGIATNRIGFSVFDSLMNDILPEMRVDRTDADPDSVDGWTKITTQFNVGTGTDATLLFAARGNADELGGFVDTVSISAVPLPAGVVLMLSGLAGLGALRRFKKV